MPKISEAVSLRDQWRAFTSDRKLVLRVLGGLLLLGNIAAAWMVANPPGGTLEELEGRRSSLAGELPLKKRGLERARLLADKVARAKREVDRFETQYFTDRRVASSTMLSELSSAAQASGIKPREHSIGFDEVEGSEQLLLMTVNAGYEGSYADLIQFLNRIDRSQRFLIMDSLSATPQQGTPMLSVNLRFHAFVRLVEAELPAITPAEGTRKL
jgi:Tfp pilus assembly protein PilO